MGLATERGLGYLRVSVFEGLGIQGLGLRVRIFKDEGF